MAKYVQFHAKIALNPIELFAWVAAKNAQNSPNFVNIFSFLRWHKRGKCCHQILWFFWDSPNLVKNQVNYISQNFVKPNIVMYFSPNLVKNYSHNFFPQNVAQFFSQNLVKKFTPQKFTKKMALKITKFGENLVTKFSFTNFGDILVHFIFTKFGDSLKFSPNLVNIFSIFFHLGP